MLCANVEYILKKYDDINKDLESVGPPTPGYNNNQQVTEKPMLPISKKSPKKTVNEEIQETATVTA